MPEITSFLRPLPTLQRKRPASGATVEPAFQKSPASNPLLGGPAADSVHFSGNKRKRGNDGKPQPPQRNQDDGSTTESGDDDWMAPLEPQGRRNAGSGAGGLIPFLLAGGGDFDPFNKPPIRPGQVMAEHIKPFDAEDDEWKPYQEAAQPYTDKLAEITSRSYKNSAFLKGDDDQMKKAVLMNLKAQSPDKHLYSVNCDPTAMNKLESHYKGPALAHLFAEPAGTLGLPTDKKPTVIALHNADPQDTAHLTTMEAFQRIKKQNPHFRFVITQPKPEAEKEEGGLKIMLGGLHSKAPTGKPAPYEHVEVAPLKNDQWVNVLHKDPQAKQILADYNLQFPPQVLKGFLDKLQKSQIAPLDREQILGEMDSLAGSIRFHNNDQSPQVTEQHVADFTKGLPNVSQALVKAPPQDMSANPMEQKPYKLIKSSEIKTRLKDVVGHQDTKDLLNEVLDAVKYPKLYAAWNKGDEDATNNNVLLMGAPGGGKTMLARAVAGEGKGTFISTSGSQFVNVYVGMGANNMRQLQSAIENAPDDLVVVFMDEIDGLGSRGKASAGEGSSEDKKTINQFLAITEGVAKKSKKQVLLIGATNKPEDLDEAILSRFHHKNYMKPLNTPERKQVLQNQIKLKNLSVDSTVDVAELAEKTEGLSGRDLRNVLKLAKLTLTKQVSPEEKQRLEHDPKARKEFKLTLSQTILEKALEDVKKGWKDTNKQSGEIPMSEEARRMYL